MNKVVSNIYVAIRYDDHRVVCFDTNLKGFIKSCQDKARISGMKGLTYYQYTFKDQEVIHHVDKFGKTFYLQKLVSNN